jgi:hypothetical protein
MVKQLSHTIFAKARMDWGARPPRALFGAPPRRTLKHTGKPAKDAIGEGADGYSRGGCAPQLPSSIFHLRFHTQSGGKMLKLSITALLFVTTGRPTQLLLTTSSTTLLVTMLPKRTTARVAISDTI